MIKMIIVSEYPPPLPPLKAPLEYQFTIMTTFLDFQSSSNLQKIVFLYFLLKTLQLYLYAKKVIFGNCLF